MDSENHHLIFIPGPGMGHIVAAVEAAKLIISRDAGFSITFLLISDPQVHKYTQTLDKDTNPRLRFINLPEAQTPKISTSELPPRPPPVLAIEHIERHQPQVRDAVLDIVKSTKSHVAGLIVDMFCLCMTDVANEFSIPSYVFFTSSAAFLSLMLCVQSLHDDDNLNITEYKDSNEKFPIPGFLNHVPAKVLPTTMMDKDGGFASVVNTARRIRQTKGVLVNTIQELEPFAIRSLSNSSGDSISVPPVYPVGSILNLNREPEHDDSDIIRWLDDQPDSSVVFLCFGSLGSFNEAQINEIAVALERIGERFLWSLRRRPSMVDEVLPTGFLERTSKVGKVIGWAPQVAVLSHPAIGGFVSHCGWNSILESLWFGVPTAAWPMYAEQQVNAFEMVVELGMATEIKMDYNNEMGDEILVNSEKIEKGIKQLMMDKDTDGIIKEKVKDMKDNSRRALLEGGSSYETLKNLIHDILQNSSSTSQV